jgi:transcription elongation factor Elf1
MSELECPYCGTYQEASCDNYNTGELYEHECEGCGKNFTYEIEYEPVYSEYKADCLNGGEHDWVDVVSTSKIAYAGVKQCRGCHEYNKKPNWKAEFDALEDK